MIFFGNLRDFFGIFDFKFFSLYFINVNSDKNKFLTHDSYFKSALKYSRSNLCNQQVYLQKKIKKRKKKNPKPHFRWFFHVRFFFGFLMPTLTKRVSSEDPYLSKMDYQKMIYDNHVGQTSTRTEKQKSRKKVCYRINVFDHQSQTVFLISSKTKRL